MAIYYTTGKNPHQRKRGVPCEPFEKVAEKLVAKGYLVRTLAELYEQPKTVVENEAIQDADSEQEVVNSEPVYSVTITKPEKPEKPKRDVKPRSKAKRPVAKSRKK